jgi:hypothetical protein
MPTPLFFLMLPLLFLPLPLLLQSLLRCVRMGWVGRRDRCGKHQRRRHGGVQQPSSGFVESHDRRTSFLDRPRIVTDCVDDRMREMAFSFSG